MPQLTVEQAREVAVLAIKAAEDNAEKLSAAREELREQAGGDPAKFGTLVPQVYTPHVIEALGDVMEQYGFTKDAGGVMMFAMAMMAHGMDPEVKAAQGKLQPLVMPSL